jgi:hypothetical protein
VSRLARLVLALTAGTACVAREKPRDTSKSPAVAETPVVPVAPDTGIVQDRADWASFEQRLPRDPEAAATELERYRRDHGLPFDFYLRPDAPEALTAGLRKEEDEMCSGTLVTAFVRQMPRDHRVLASSPAIEFDSTGRLLRQWPLPSDVEFSEIVAGVSGEELIASYAKASSGVFMRIKPNGEYTISAQAPQPLGPEEWIEVAESTYVRVRPKDDGTFSTYPSGARPGPLGTWVPRGDSGWYVRTDSVAGGRSVARAVALPREPSPRMVSCPAAPSFEGMICRGFPDGQQERRIAFPTPCS